MGNRSSKSVNITANKGEVVAEENHVNGEALKSDNIIEGAKEQVKDLMKDIANEAVKKGEEVKEMGKEKENEVKETTTEVKEEGGEEAVTPAKEGEEKETKEKEKSEKKKSGIGKKLSFRRFSFLRKEKKAKEAKQNGTVEKKEDEKAEGAEVKDEKQENAEVPKEGEKAEVVAPEVVTETVAKVEVIETLKVEETMKETETPAVVEKVEETKVEEIKIETIAHDESKEEVSVAEKVESLMEDMNNLEVNGVNHDVSTTISEKTIESVKVPKESMDEIMSETITNGVGERNGHKEVEAAE